MGQTAFGLVTDRTRDIIRTDPKLVDAAPALLTRGEGDAEVVSICRLDGGKRLIAVLSPERLFRSDLVRRVLDDQSSQPMKTITNGAQTMSDQQFVIFRLGHQEYGLPIAAVDEIARVPEQISKLPKAPAFIDGVMNLRGHVVPIVDLRRRFEIPSQATSDAQRMLVLSIAGAKTGFLVDAVSEVARISGAQIQPAPELSEEQMRIINQIANLGDRMILLVEASQLLNRIESDMLAEFDHASARQELQIS
jgi:purine-binding chemotaxis protein CheW